MRKDGDTTGVRRSQLALRQPTPSQRSPVRASAPSGGPDLRQSVVLWSATAHTTNPRSDQPADRVCSPKPASPSDLAATSPDTGPVRPNPHRPQAQLSDRPPGAASRQRRGLPPSQRLLSETGSGIGGGAVAIVAGSATGQQHKIEALDRAMPRKASPVREARVAVAVRRRWALSALRALQPLDIGCPAVGGVLPPHGPCRPCRSWALAPVAHPVVSAAATLSRWSAACVRPARTGSRCGHDRGPTSSVTARRSAKSAAHRRQHPARVPIAPWCDG